MNTRTEPELFAYDSVESGWDRTDLFDFEGSFSGDDGSSLYSSVGLSMFGSDQFRVLPNVYGTLTHGSLGGQIYNDGVTNPTEDVFQSIHRGDWILYFGSRWDFFTGSLFGFAIHRPRRRDLDGGQYSGGHFGAFTFATPVDYLVLDGELGDGFGIDNIEVVWTTYTDSDLDGYTEAGGDCDDTNPNVNPSVPEDYTNGIDDDCDGAVDGGAVESFDDLQTFEDTWNPIRGTLTEQLIGFESVPVGFALTTEYADLGWQVDATISAGTDVDDGVAPNGIRFGWSLDQSWVWDFEEPQQAVGF